MKKEYRQKFVEYLNELFPNAECELNYNSPFQLLVAVILSAQCTDKRVNMVVPVLFDKFKTIEDFATANLSELEEVIKPCGFYHNKAKNIKNCSIALIEKFGGVIPNTVEQLMTLPGVGMKTAKVVCSNLYKSNVIAVDTHVLRVSNRVGFVNQKNPDKCSQELEEIFKKDLHTLHHTMVLFGRYYCKAINPKCANCRLKDFCKHFKSLGK